MVRHRVEVLHPGATAHLEFWSNAAGTVYLCREGDVWQALVDGEPVADRSGCGSMAALQPLVSSSPAALIPLLAMQEALHLILEPARLDGLTPPFDEVYG